MTVKVLNHHVTIPDPLALYEVQNSDKENYLKFLHESGLWKPVKYCTHMEAGE